MIGSELKKAAVAGRLVVYLRQKGSDDVQST